MSLLKKLNQKLNQKLSSSEFSNKFRTLPIIDASLEFDNMAIGDGFTKEKLVNVDGSNFVGDQFGINGTTINMDQSTQADKPQYINNSINGKPAILYDGTTDYLTAAENDELSLTGDCTFFFVGRKDDSGTVGNLLSKGNLAYRARIKEQNQINFIYTDNIGFQSIDTPINVITTGKPFIISIVVKMNDSIKFYVDGALVANIAITSLSISINAVHLLVGSFDGVSEFFKGAFGEMAVYNRALLDSERQLNENYFSAKWIIPLA